jgi:hypothetical protein
MKTVDFDADARLLDTALYLPGHRTLAIADVHVGFEDALHRDGTLVPRGHLRALLERLERLLRAIGVSEQAPLERVIVNGDLRHQFGPLTAREWQESQRLLEALRRVSREVILVEGNHDGNLAMLAEDHESVAVRRSYRLGALLFLHGDHEPEEIPSGMRTLVIGHEHPAVGLRDRVTGRVELYKCFLAGPGPGRRTLLVQPAFNPWTQGSDLLRETPLSPLLYEDALGEFDVYVVSDAGDVYPFGPLGQLHPAGGRVR